MADSMAGNNIELVNIQGIQIGEEMITLQDLEADNIGWQGLALVPSRARD